MISLIATALLAISSFLTGWLVRSQQTTADYIKGFKHGRGMERIATARRNFVDYVDHMTEEEGE